MRRLLLLAAFAFLPGAAHAAFPPGWNCPYDALSAMHRDIAGLALRDEQIAALQKSETSNVMARALAACSAKNKWTRDQEKDASTHLIAQLRLHGALAGLKDNKVDIPQLEKIYAGLSQDDILDAADDDDAFDDLLIEFLGDDIRKGDSTANEWVRNITAWLDARTTLDAEKDDYDVK